MAKVECPLCHRMMIVRENSKNVMFVDGVACHKKCPKPPVPEEEKIARRELIDRITFHIVHNNRNEKAMVMGFNWQNINMKVNELHKAGYSYGDIQYALDEVVNMQNGFWGFGAVVNNIAVIMQRKKAVEEAKAKITNKPVEDVFVYKPKKKYTGGLI